jgi:hypothetical protein
MPYTLLPPGTRRGNKTFVVRGTHEGQRFEATTNTVDPDAAQQWAQAFLNIIEEAAGRRPEHIKLGPFERWFLKHHRLHNGVIYRLNGTILRFYALPSGYRNTKVAFNGGMKTVLEHRMIYLLKHGELPRSIDHKNRKRADNTEDNLLPATPLTQAKNRSLPSRTGATLGQEA